MHQRRHNDSSCEQGTCRVSRLGDGVGRGGRCDRAVKNLFAASRSSHLLFSSRTPSILSASNLFSLHCLTLPLPSMSNEPADDSSFSHHGGASTHGVVAVSRKRSAQSLPPPQVEKKARTGEAYQEPKPVPRPEQPVMHDPRPTYGSPQSLDELGGIQRQLEDPTRHKYPENQRHVLAQQEGLSTARQPNVPESAVSPKPKNRPEPAMATGALSSQVTVDRDQLTRLRGSLEQIKTVAAKQKELTAKQKELIAKLSSDLDQLTSCEKDLEDERRSPTRSRELSEQNLLVIAGHCSTAERSRLLLEFAEAACEASDEKPLWFLIGEEMVVDASSSILPELRDQANSVIRLYGSVRGVVEDKCIRQKTRKYKTTFGQASGNYNHSCDSCMQDNSVCVRKIEEGYLARSVFDTDGWLVG
ncbi:hypothetical protein BDV95DRAFT_578499 [Massariosphaeria phaeospora]|uniref:Uncharacterized protein n=1 Tax=Massariosphaeria phaeospora TaxID=100035 RepID=A0A7C8MBP5_9PLEO|nr:hypothetical protein BDV95DRAFT_578499 [Massariosphaeria phaeospora]